MHSTSQHYRIGLTHPHIAQSFPAGHRITAAALVDLKKQQALPRLGQHGSTIEGPVHPVQVVQGFK